MKELMLWFIFIVLILIGVELKKNRIALERIALVMEEQQR